MNFTNLFTKCRNFGEYLPLVLVTLLFVAENELGNHAISVAFQLGITAIVLCIFYLTLACFGGRYIALFIAVVIWIALIYLKKSYLVKKIL